MQERTSQPVRSTNATEYYSYDLFPERRNVKIIQPGPTVAHNPYLLSEQDERETLKKQSENKQRLRVPRRPPWTKSMTTAQLERQEKDAFLDWRRGIAECVNFEPPVRINTELHRLQERDSFLLTPFERNIEVWRQLWRVLERSHLVVQIVDARNPLRFRCEDLEAYVQDVEGAEGEKGTGKGLRKSLLLINKSDLLTAKQRFVVSLCDVHPSLQVPQPILGRLLRRARCLICVLLCSQCDRVAGGSQGSTRGYPSARGSR